MKPIPLATPEELRAIAKRACDAIDVACDDGPTGLSSDEETAHFELVIRTSFDALRYCVNSAVLLKDPSLAPLVVQAIEARDGFSKELAGEEDTYVEALGALLAMGGSITEDLVDLARHVRLDVRKAIATNLRITGPEEQAIIDTLLQDPAANVRRSARARQDATPPWWFGKLGADPTPSTDAREADEDLAATLGRIDECLEREGGWMGEHFDEVLEDIQSLPDGLVVDLLEHLYLSDFPWGRSAALVAELLSRPGGPAAFLRSFIHRLNAETSEQDQRAVFAAIAALEQDRRVEVCLELAHVALGYPDDERRGFWDPPRQIAEMVDKGWPRDVDTTPLLDIILGLPPEPRSRPSVDGYDWVYHALRSCIATCTAPSMSLLSRVARAYVDDFAPPWQGLDHTLGALIDRAPPRLLRPYAEQAIHSQSDRVVEWGLRLLLQRLHDPARDPPRAEWIARLYADPRYRRVVVRHAELSQIAVPLLRVDLRADALDLDGAEAAMLAIDRLYGTWGQRDEQADARHAQLRETLRGCLGPTELRGPATDQEWRNYRAVRATVSDPTRDVMWAFHLIPPGPWHPLDREYVEREVELVKTEPLGRAYYLVNLLKRKPDVALLPLFDVLESHAKPDQIEDVREARDSVRVALGLEVGEASD